MRNILSRLAATIILATTALTAAASAQAVDEGGVSWTVQTVDNANGTGRANFTYDVVPGQTIEDAMRVTNTGTVTLPLTVYAADAFTTASGEIDILTTGTESVDAGQWVHVGEPHVELQPGEAADIPITITVPADARPGDHAAGLVTSYVTEASSTINIDRRLGSRINLRVAGELHPDAGVADLKVSYAASWNPFSAGTILVQYTFENTGNTRVTAYDAVAASGPLDIFSTATEPTQLPEVLPGSRIDVHRELPVMSLGWVSGELTVAPEGVGLGAGSMDRVAIPFSVAAIPWGLLALSILLAIAVTVAVMGTQRHRKRREVSTADRPES